MGEFQGGAALKSTGELWTWGFNASGQLGNQTLTNNSSPILVVGSHLFTKISCGLNFMAGLKSDGSIWAWGTNLAENGGQLGDNTTTSRSSPVAVVGSHVFTDIACGRVHSLALKANGEVWAWGDNRADASGGNGNEGQLGDNTVTSRSSPVLVVGGHSFIEIAAGGYHSLGRKVDGTVWAWGMNATSVGIGQLGDGTTTDRSSPVLVIGAHSFVEISAGNYTSYGRKTNGEIWAWGYSAEGELGDNTTTSKSSPVLVVGAHSFVQIRGGGFFAIARKANGEAWTWGFNSTGQLGDFTITQRNSPVSVVGGHSFVAIGSGFANSFGRKENGEVWGWGANSSGQTGDWTTTNRSSPVAVVGSV